MLLYTDLSLIGINMNRYEDPTQRLQSHNWSEEYKENYDKIFGKKETWLERRIREEKESMDPMIDGVIPIPISEKEKQFLLDMEAALKEKEAHDNSTS